MATTEELYKLSLQIKGLDDLDNAQKKLAAAESLLKQLIQAQGGVGTSSAQMSASLKNQVQVVQRLRDELEAVNKSNAKLSGGWKANTSGISQLGYAVDDLQYGQWPLGR